MRTTDWTKVFVPADILLPAEADMEKWSVIACDQHTSEPEYWERVEETVGESASTYRMMLPESKYKSPELDALVSENNSAMQRYLDGGVFREYPDSFVYVERRLRGGKVRCGIVGAVDLDSYDYFPGSDAPIRASEGIVKDRLPVRIRLRRDAPLDMPHVLMLVDDPDELLIEPLAAAKEQLPLLYDFDLMEGGGHITGRLVSGEAAERVTEAVCRLSDQGRFNDKYGIENEAVILFAVGDGNHSLATAKHCWEEIRKGLTEEQRKNHPARFALVEVVNIREDSLEFEPINRVVFGVEPQRLLRELADFYPGTREGEWEGHCLRYIHGASFGTVTIPGTAGVLAVGVLTRFLDDYIARVGGTIDYVHGGDVVRRVASGREDCVGFVLPAINKAGLFLSVIKDGVLPRKTFSMGHSFDKRYYLECRRVK